MNTMTSVLSKFAPNLDPQNFHGLSRLDQNRAVYQVASKCKVPVSSVDNVLVWGNHSDTQYPDLEFCTIDSKPLKEYLNDPKWAYEEFVETVAMRWLDIVSHRKQTSCMSAANAIKDHLRDWFQGSSKLSTMAVISNGENNYGIPKEICFASPCINAGNFNVSVADLKVDDFCKAKIKKSVDELIEEYKVIEKL